jgi:hypothetical protein
LSKEGKDERTPAPGKDAISPPSAGAKTWGIDNPSGIKLLSNSGVSFSDEICLMFSAAFLASLATLGV